MVATPHTKPCPACSGTGLVARAVSPLAEGDHVGGYLRSGMPEYGQELCGRCNGSGVVPISASDVVERSDVPVGDF